MKYGNRSPWKKIVSSPITLAVVFIVFGLMAKATWNVHEKALVSADRLEQAQMSFDKLEQRQTDLSKKVEYLSTDEGIKSEIRDKFRAAEDGESVAVIVDNNQFATTSSTTTVAKKSWWRRIFGL